MGADDNQQKVGGVMANMAAGWDLLPDIVRGVWDDGLAFDTSRLILQVIHSERHRHMHRYMGLQRQAGGWNAAWSQLYSQQHRYYHFPHVANNNRR
jgi:hypothetical protein